jgi:hypothetical protein
MAIKFDMVSAIKVQFLEPIFEDDFVEKGMTAWLTDIEWDESTDCYKLYFDFTEFEDINAKYFKAIFHPNRHTKHLEEQTGRKLFTAMEAGQYEPKYSVYFSVGNMTTRDDFAFAEEITDYLKEVE